jgi:hypothetical protein
MRTKWAWNVCMELILVGGAGGLGREASQMKSWFGKHYHNSESVNVRDPWLPSLPFVA